MENAIRQKTYGEIPQDPNLYLLCGISNLKLGYLIIAEQLFTRCLLEPDISSDAQKHLAEVYRE